MDILCSRRPLYIYIRSSQRRVVLTFEFSTKHLAGGSNCRVLVECCVEVLTLGFFAGSNFWIFRFLENFWVLTISCSVCRRFQKQNWF